MYSLAVLLPTLCQKAETRLVTQLATLIRDQGATAEALKSSLCTPVPPYYHPRRRTESDGSTVRATLCLLNMSNTARCRISRSNRLGQRGEVLRLLSQYPFPSLETLDDIEMRLQQSAVCGRRHCCTGFHLSLETMAATRQDGGLRRR